MFCSPSNPSSSASEVAIELVHLIGCSILLAAILFRRSCKDNIFGSFFFSPVFLLMMDHPTFSPYFPTFSINRSPASAQRKVTKSFSRPIWRRKIRTKKNNFPQKDIMSFSSLQIARGGQGAHQLLHHQGEPHSDRCHREARREDSGLLIFLSFYLRRKPADLLATLVVVVVVVVVVIVVVGGRITFIHGHLESPCMVSKKSKARPHIFISFFNFKSPCMV